MTKKAKTPEISGPEQLRRAQQKDEALLNILGLAEIIQDDYNKGIYDAQRVLSLVGGISALADDGLMY